VDRHSNMNHNDGFMTEDWTELKIVQQQKGLIGGYSIFLKITSWELTWMLYAVAWLHTAASSNSARSSECHQRSVDEWCIAGLHYWRKMSIIQGNSGIILLSVSFYRPVFLQLIHVRLCHNKILFLVRGRCLTNPPLIWYASIKNFLGAKIY